MSNDSFTSTSPSTTSETVGGLLVDYILAVFILYHRPAHAAVSEDADVLVETRRKIDGIPVAECQKLWCRDLETGKVMGNEDKANSGYQSTSFPQELCDSEDNCVLCWGERRWCSGEARGEWNPEYGAYTRGGDNATYESYQKGGCFVWRLEKPDCEKGKTAILENGKWVCAVSSGTAEGGRASGVRRGSSLRGIRQ